MTRRPVRGSYLLARDRGRHRGDIWLVRLLKRGNAALLGWAFRHCWFVVGSACAAVVVAGIAAANLPRAFLPPFNEGSLSLGLAYNPGISRAESHRLGLVAERLIREVPEVTSVGRRTGRAEMDEHAAGVHSFEIDVDLKPGRPKEAMVAETDGPNQVMRENAQRRIAVFGKPSGRPAGRRDTGLGWKARSRPWRRRRPASACSRWSRSR